MILADFNGAGAERNGAHSTEHAVRRLGASGAAWLRGAAENSCASGTTVGGCRCGGSDCASRFLELRSFVLGDRDRPRRQSSMRSNDGCAPTVGQGRKRERDEIVEQNHGIATGAGRALIGPNRAWMRPESAAHVEDAARGEAEVRRVSGYKDAVRRELQLQQRSKRKRQGKAVHAPNVAKDIRSRLLSSLVKQRIEIVVKVMHAGKNVGLGVMQSHRGFGVFDLDALNPGQIMIEDRMRCDVGKVDLSVIDSLWFRNCDQKISISGAWAPSPALSVTPGRLENGRLRVECEGRRGKVHDGRERPQCISGFSNVVEARCGRPEAEVTSFCMCPIGSACLRFEGKSGFRSQNDAFARFDDFGSVASPRRSQAHVRSAGRRACGPAALPDRGAGALSDIKPAKAKRERTDSASETEPNKPASAIEALEAASFQGEAGAGVDSAPAVEGEAGTRDLAIATQGGHIVAEIELEPLTLRPQLPPSSEENASVETAVGFWGRYRLFTITVVLPTLIGSFYLFALAAPRFASSASFIVRSAAQSGLPDAVTSLTQQSASGAQQGAPALQQGQGASMIAQDETYAINAYLTSRDVVDQLSKNNHLRGILGRPEGDFIFRYPTLWLPNDSESFYQRFKWMVSAYVDPTTMISTIEVNAFRPEDAQALATAMLEYAEALVNQMNQRSYDDGLATANRFVAEAQKEVDAVEAELKAYRNASASIDPNAVAQSKLKVIEGLLTQLGQIQATIAQQTAITPTSPNLAALRAQAQSYRAEIEKRQLEIAGSSGSEADKLATYEELTTRGELAAQALAAAVAERDQARNSAERQHLFIQVIARPNLSGDYARYPRKTLDLTVLLAICSSLFLILRKVGGTAGAHGV